MHTHTHTHTYTHTHMHAYTHIHTRIHTHTYIYTALSHSEIQFGGILTGTQRFKTVKEITLINDRSETRIPSSELLTAPISLFVYYAFTCLFFIDPLPLSLPLSLSNFPFSARIFHVSFCLLFLYLVIFHDLFSFHFIS
jgi:hypothetical protein